MLKYPLRCPRCKLGRLEWELSVFLDSPKKPKGILVCQECRFCLADDNPSERLSKRDQIWDEAWDELMS